MARTEHKYLEGLRFHTGGWYLNDCNPGGGCTTQIDGSNWTAISNDGNVGNFHTPFGTGQDGAIMELDLARYQLAANERCANVRYNVWGGTRDVDKVARIDVFLGATGKPNTSVVIQQGTSWTWYSPYANNGEWTQAQIDDAYVQCRDSIAGGGTGCAAIGAINWDLDIRTKPVVSGVGGYSGTGAPSNPQITWNCNLQGDAARKFQVHVRRQSDNALVYDSGELFGGGSSGNAHNASGLQAGVTYIMHVRQATDFNGGEYWSDWVQGNTLTVAMQPVATITGPSGIGHTLTPTVTWTNDFSNNTARAYQVVISRDSDGAWVYDSGRIGGQATSHVTGTILLPGTNYTAWVRIANDSQGSDFWSNWSSSTFVTATVPSVTVTGPTGTITTTNQPNVTWTYTSTAPQATYVVKIFASADYDSPGFDPETWSASWNSGVLSGAVLLQKVLQALPANVTFKAYVKAANTNGTYSPWASL